MMCLLRVQSPTFYPWRIKDTQGASALSYLAHAYWNCLFEIILHRSVRKFHYRHRIWIPFDFYDKGILSR